MLIPPSNIYQLKNFNKFMNIINDQIISSIIIYILFCLFNENLQNYLFFRNYIFLVHHFIFTNKYHILQFNKFIFIFKIILFIYLCDLSALNIPIKTKVQYNIFQISFFMFWSVFLSYK